MGVVERVHAHLLDHQIAGLGFEPGHRRSSPGAAHQRLGLGHAPEERRVKLQSGRPFLDDVVNVDDRHAGLARGLGEGLHVLRHVLRLGVRRRARIGEGAALRDHVVLQVLDDERAARRVQFEGHGSSPTCNSGDCRRP